jgi:hypothetical protein
LLNQQPIEEMELQQRYTDKKQKADYDVLQGKVGAVLEEKFGMSLRKKTYFCRPEIEDFLPPFSVPLTCLRKQPTDNTPPMPLHDAHLGGFFFYRS